MPLNTESVLSSMLPYTRAYRHQAAIVPRKIRAHSEPRRNRSIPAIIPVRHNKLCGMAAERSSGWASTRDVSRNTKISEYPNHRTQRTPRVRYVFIDVKSPSGQVTDGGPSGAPEISRRGAGQLLGGAPSSVLFGFCRHGVRNIHRCEH